MLHSAQCIGPTNNSRFPHLLVELGSCAEAVFGRVQLNDRKLTIATTAKAAADIFAGEVVVCGAVKGNVHAKKRIEIKKEGSVTGDLTTPQILIEDGAYFKGTIKVELSVDQEANKNVSPKTESEPDAPLTGRKVA